MLEVIDLIVNDALRLGRVLADSLLHAYLTRKVHYESRPISGNTQWTGVAGLGLEGGNKSSLPVDEDT